MMTEREPTLEEMLAEVKQIREELASLSDSARNISEAIRAILGDDFNSDQMTYVEYFEAGIRHG